MTGSKSLSSQRLNLLKRIDFLTPYHGVDTLARLMAPDPVFFNPLVLVEQQGSLDGQLEVKDMKRLAEIIQDDSGTIDYHLQLGRDEFEFPYIKGYFKTTLKLVCQRCLNPFDLRLRSEMSIGMALSEEEIERLPRHYEPLLLTTEQVSLLTLIEDEVLLSVPMVPVHEDDACQASGLIEGSKPERENPFAELKKLVIKNSKS